MLKYVKMSLRHFPVCLLVDKEIPFSAVCLHKQEKSTEVISTNRKFV